MKATELRIGNYVYSITCNGEKVIDKVNHVDQQGVIASGIGWMEQKPIPLTEQWLKDFGLEHEGETISRLKLDTEYGIITIPLKENYLFHNCKYVHQLQNLYFALTEKELIKK